MKTLLPLSFLTLASVPATAQIGAALEAVHINDTLGGFSGALDDEDRFGHALAKVGDLDGDGITELAVSAPLDDDGGPNRGALWILFLNADGSVRTQQKISQTSGGFAGTLADNSLLGWTLAGVGDLDADGKPELVAFGGVPNRFLIFFLDAAGTVHGHAEILASDPAFGGALFARDFGRGLASLGDRDGDGFPDLALGAPGMDNGQGSVWIVRLGLGGVVSSAHRIAEGVGGFTGDLEPEDTAANNGDGFGFSLAALGDLDGDGHADLGVFSGQFLSLGSLWTLHLDANELVVGHTEHGIGEYGLAMPNGSTWGTSDQVATLGDLDGDGVEEVAIDYSYVDLPGGPDFEGGVGIASLRADGSVRRKLLLARNRGGLGELPGGRSSGFGTSPVALGDLDGDGARELAVGAPGERSAGGVRKGALWILSLDPDAARNGSGANPLLLSQTVEPALGQVWTPTLDCSADPAGVATLYGFSEPSAGSFLPAGEILVGGTRFFLASAAHAGTATGFALAVPVDLALVNRALFTQGACSGGVLRLSNALDVVIGE
ncbi:MAG: integrin alpha [Planctomycetota bacterium]